MHYILAVVAFVITFSSCGSSIPTITVSFSDSEDCEICSSCMNDLGYLDDPIISNPTFGKPAHCVDYCVGCYARIGEPFYFDCTADSLVVDSF